MPRQFFKLDPLKTIDHSINYLPPALEDDFIPAGYNEESHIAAEKEIVSLIEIDNQIKDIVFTD